jgi:hypothetical protein
MSNLDDNQIKQMSVMLMVRMLKLPQGKGGTLTPTSYTWTKNGGQYSRFGDIVDAASKAGFRIAGVSNHNSPDGSVIGRGSVFNKGNWQLELRRSYGVVAADNWFQVTLTNKKEQAGK